MTGDWALAAAMDPQPVFFEDAAALRRWFAKHAGRERVLHAGFMKKGSGKPSITWPESVDEALCVGWIDGVRKRIDADSYRIRFTPRRSGSHWSNINIRRLKALAVAGRVKAAGLAAFKARNPAKSGRASYEQHKTIELAPQDIRAFRRHAAAWKYYSACPPGYRKLMNWWVTTAKKTETRTKRLAKLIEACAHGRRL